jgi:hypothetical protein
MLSAIDTLALILDELGTSSVYEIEPPFHSAQLRQAALRCDNNTVFVSVVSDADEAARLHRLLLPLADEVTVSTVEEGFLVLARPSTSARSSHSSREHRRPAWSTPDARPVPGATDADLSTRTLHRWLERATRQERRQVPRVGSNEDQQLGSWGLLALDGNVWRPSVAAMVLGGRRPEVFLPGCRLIGRVDGKAIDIRGGVQSMLQVLGRRLKQRHRDLIVRVVREALLHRDWSSDEAVTVRLAMGRLTVDYPGRIGKKPTNPLLLHLARELGTYAGEGLAKLDAYLQRARLPKSTWFARDGWVHVVADMERPRRPRRGAPAPIAASPREDICKPEPTSSREREPSTPTVVEDVESLSSVMTAVPVAPTAVPVAPPAVPVAPAAVPPDPAPPSPAFLPRDPDARAEAVLSILTRGRASTREIAAAMGCSRPVIGKVLTALVAEGRVTRVAASSRSPFQTYEVT